MDNRYNELPEIIQEKLDMLINRMATSSGVISQKAMEANIDTFSEAIEKATLELLKEEDDER
jgi:hypothetical protein|tara:strand:- start:1019 stop:1204 length:186 start_codon:yes stop_codon:yes gene_type:complete